MISLIFVFSLLVLLFIFYKKISFPSKLISYNPYKVYLTYSLYTSFILSLLLPFDISTNTNDFIFTYFIVFLFYFLFFFLTSFFTSLKKKDFTTLKNYFFYASLTIYVALLVFIFILPSSFTILFFSSTFITMIYLSLLYLVRKKYSIIIKRLLLLDVVLFITSILFILF